MNNVEGFKEIPNPNEFINISSFQQEQTFIAIIKSWNLLKQWDPSTCGIKRWHLSNVQIVLQEAWKSAF